MAITSPIPPMGATPPMDLSGMAQMFGAPSGKEQMEALMEKARPAMRLLGDLEEMINQAPEIMPLVRSILESKFMKKPGARAPKDKPQAAAAPQIPPLALGAGAGAPGASLRIPPMR